MKKLSYILILCGIIFVSCGKEEDEEPYSPGSLLFDYYADAYTDTYTLQDGKVEIRAEYEAYSTWSKFLYYLRIEQSIRLSLQDLTTAEVLNNPDAAARMAEAYFNRKFTPRRYKIRKFRFDHVRLIE